MAVAVHGLGEIEVVAGLTVGLVRDAYGHVLNVPPDAEALVNGRPVQQHHVVQDEDTLEFIKASGRKGAGPWAKTDDELCEFLKGTPEDLDFLENQGCKPLRLKDGTRRWTADAIDEFNGIKKQPMDSPWLTHEEAAAYLKISPDALYAHVDRGRIKPFKVGVQSRYTRPMLDKFVKGE